MSLSKATLNTIVSALSEKFDILCTEEEILDTQLSTVSTAKGALEHAVEELEECLDALPKE